MNELRDDMRRLLGTAVIVIVLLTLGALYERRFATISSLIRLPNAKTVADKVIVPADPIVPTVEPATAAE